MPAGSEGQRSRCKRLRAMMARHSDDDADSRIRRVSVALVNRKVGAASASGPVPRPGHT